MDKYSFLNAAHTSYFAALYDKYLVNPDSVEPSWRAFFQGYDFGHESLLDELDLAPANAGMALSGATEVPESLQKEFQVIRLIDGYRSRGHLFTKTNPVRDRRTYKPTLDLENFGLSSADLDTVFTELLKLYEKSRCVRCCFYLYIYIYICIYLERKIYIV